MGWRIETLPQQVIKNLAAVQQERLSIWLYVGSGKLILAVMYLWRVGVDGRSYAAAPALVSTVVMSLEPAAKISA